MAENMRAKNYQVMIEALYDFGARTAQIGNDIQLAANTCRNTLGEEDSSIAAIYAQAALGQKAFNEVALRALRIAKDMAEELKQGELDLMLWETE